MPASRPRPSRSPSSASTCRGSAASATSTSSAARRRATLGPSDALVTERLAASDGLDVGSGITVLGAGAPVRATVAGILAGDGPLPGDAGRTVVLGLETAASLNRADGVDPATAGTLAGLSRIDVVLAAGADPATVTTAIEQALTVEPYVLSTPADVAASLRASTADIRSTMALLAAISLFAAAFVILNTLAMTVSERVRELGLLRAAGARRAQIVEVVVAQALIVGTLGSVIGLRPGRRPRRDRLRVAARLGRGPDRCTRDHRTRARRRPVCRHRHHARRGDGAGSARRVDQPGRRPARPVRCRQDRAVPRASWVIAIVVLVGALAAVLLPPTTGSGAFPIRAVAVYVVLLFAVLVTPAVLGPLGRIAGLPFAGPLRLEERLARAAIARDRSRTTVTIGALVIGLAMVVALGAVATNARASASAWLSEVVPGDEVLTAIAPSPVGEDGLEHEIAAIDGVTRATPIAAFDLAFAGTRLDAVAIRGADFGADGRLIFTAGDRDAALAAVDAGGVSRSCPARAPSSCASASAT